MSFIFLKGLAWVSREPERRLRDSCAAQTAVPLKAVTHGPLLGIGAIHRQSGLTLTGAFWNHTCEDRNWRPIE